MRLRVLERSQFIARPVGEVFAFFENPENLAVITPPDLGFRITSARPVVMARGAKIEYTIRLMGVPVRWRTRISSYDPPRGFEDEQEHGPYALWRHMHTFEPTEGGTLMHDRVTYAVPWGWIGRIAHWLYVDRKLRAIFDFRARTISMIFTSGSPVPMGVQEKTNFT